MSSNIIQSFFIEPVVRQARKLSAAAVREDENPGPQSHVRPPNSSNSERTRTQRRGAIAYSSDHNAAVRLGHAVFDRFVPLWSSPSTTQAVATISPPLPSPPTNNGNNNPMPAIPPPEGSVDLDPPLVDTRAGAEADMSSNNPLYRPTGPLQTSGPAPRYGSSGGGRRARRNTGRFGAAAAARGETSPVSDSLPEDDGMRMLRRQIHEVRDMAASSEEKARKMHALMTQDWNIWQARLHARSPASFTSQEPVHPPRTPRSRSTSDSRPFRSSTWSSTTIDPHDPYNLTSEDLLPSYRHLPPSPDVVNDAPLPSTESSSSSDPLSPTEPILGCKHYKRNVKIQCFDCKRWFPCRHCHDEAYDAQGEPDHKLNRKRTENMFCMLCLTAQPAAQYCRECGKRAAYYYCDLCKLWDDDNTKRIYHCGDCGICRRGEGLGKDYVHCKKCNVCISIQFASGHRCIERATDCDCPICGDYMFTSSADIVAMPCGHYLHHTCYLAYMESAYKCPICKKSAVNMELQWRKLEHAIESQPMPPQFRETKVEIRCNDCGGRGVVPYHWLGNKCGVCDGFNTNEVRLLGADEGTRHDVAVYAEEERSHRRAREEAGRRRFQQQQLLQPRSYFADEDGSSAAAAPTAGDDSVGGRFALPALPTLNVSPYEMLERVNRSLSPIRHYFDSDDALNNQTRPWSVGREASPTSATTGDEELGFWARNRHWFMSSEGEDDYSGDDSTEGEDDEDDEDEEMGSGMDDDDVDDDDDDSSEDGELDLRLIGHR